ncbi:MAG: hypothetical protein KME07_05620 [Pegethrix bostrychoides GSE-TBD4-15B]|jgi:hypothetical protein|uniref:Uncharacterized protein n=1 Tax=Pegethrix bostrychoides GSE-TBD4-15B TaxID=2839662 RepID=A0A951P899_9CYAN|nr:hypothetical protein [Pegethrix bostrychoides GSE-TBD4-15B]
MTVQLKLFTSPKTKVAKLNRLYFLYSYSKEECAYIPEGSVHRLHCSDGQFHLDQIPLVQPQIDRDSISWVQRTASHFTAGNLLFSSDGVTAYGTITHGDCPTTATSHSVMATAIPPATYTTQITKRRYPVGTDPNALPAEAWQPGLELKLGCQYNLHEGISQPMVQLAQQDMSGHFALQTDGNNQLKVTLDLKDEASFHCSEDPELYVAAQIILSPLGEHFTGIVSQLCSDRAGDGVYLWKGLVPSPSKHFQAPVLNQLSAEALVQDLPLDVNILVSLVPNDTVTQLSQTLLVENMKWSMGRRDYEKQWLSDFFAQNPPVLDPVREASRISVITQDLSWYQDKFAVAYLAKGLSTSPNSTTPPPIQLNEIQKAKLEYYLTHGMGESDEYNTQSSGVFTQAYLLGQRNLGAYIQDGGQKWAALLLDELTTPAKLNSVFTALLTDGYEEVGIKQANNYTALLGTLDPSGEYAKKYQERLFGRLTLQTGIYNTTVWDEETTLNWLPQTLENLAATVPDTPTSLRATAVSSDFQGAVDDIKNAFKYFGDATKTAKAIFGIFALYKGYGLVNQLTQAKAAFAAAYPTLGGLGKLLNFLSMVGGVFNTAISFMNWDSQKDGSKKVGIITKTIDLVKGFAELGIDLLDPFVKGSQQALKNAISEAARLDSVMDDIVTEMINDAIDIDEAMWRTQAVQSAIGLVDQETKQLVPKASWENVFGKAKLVAKVAGILITATTLALNIYDFVKDIQDGKPIQQIVMDGITMGMTLGSLIVQIVEIAITSVVCTVLSAVFAFLGIVITVINLFLPKPQTPPPAQTFQEQHAVPFTDALPSPPAATARSKAPDRIVAPKVQLIYNLA